MVNKHCERSSNAKSASDNGGRGAPGNCVRSRIRYYETKERSPVYGAHPILQNSAGRNAARRWIAVMTAEGRKVPQNDPRALALRSMIA